MTDSQVKKHRYKVGDRVVLNLPGTTSDGKTGTITALHDYRGEWYNVDGDEELWMVNADEILDAK